MKTIPEFLRERELERQRKAARRNAMNLAGLMVMVALLCIASAIVLVLAVSALRLADLAPAFAGLTP